MQKEALGRKCVQKVNKLTARLESVALKEIRSGVGMTTRVRTFILHASSAYTSILTFPISFYKFYAGNDDVLQHVATP